MIAETRWPTGHFFGLNLKSQSLFPLALADLAGRKKEHDARALKRQSVAWLRQGAGKGRKVLWVWDKAAVNRVASVSVRSRQKLGSRRASG